MLILAVATTAASGAVQTFPRDGWGGAKISQRGGVWTVKAGADSLRISASPKGQFESLLVVSNTADSLVVDATGFTGANARRCTLLSCASMSGSFDPGKVTVLTDKPTEVKVAITAKGIVLRKAVGALIMVY